MTLDMRTIKFRGKCCHSDAWAYGNLVDYEEEECPEIQGFDVFREGRDVWQEINVERDTIGQFTGLRDKNGKEIYEGDIVRTNRYVTSVIYHEAGFRLRVIENKKISPLYMRGELEVIGNIYDDEQLV